MICTYYTGWWFGTCSPYIGNFITPSDFNSIIFQRGIPATSIDMVKIHSSIPAHSAKSPGFIFRDLNPRRGQKKIEALVKLGVPPRWMVELVYWYGNIMEYLLIHQLRIVHLQGGWP